MVNKKEKMIFKRTNIRLLMFCFAIAAVFLAICSKSSFLYPINDWVDSNCFFTVGKAMMNGRVLYADIYEQKGPLLYFIHGLAYLISHDTFLGVYFLEVISFGIFLYFSTKCAKLYVKSERLSYFISPLLALVILISRSFAHGDSAEEFSLSFFSYTLYSVLLAIHEKRLLTRKEALINGICAACILWIKYTMLGFYIGMVLFVFVWYLIEKAGRKLMEVVLFFLIGAGLASMPILLYFVCMGAVKDLYEVYVYNNIFLYSEEVPTESKIVLIKNAFFDTIRYNLSYSIFLICGLVWMAMKNIRESAAVFFSFAGLVMGVYFGGRSYVYYGLILSIYAIFGISAMFCEALNNRKWMLKNRRHFYMYVLIQCICFAFISYKTSGNVYLMHYEKGELPQYQFAEKINEKEDARLLNYGFLDGGFYLAADLIPECKYFCGLNINLDELWEGQNKYIEEGVADFVITRNVRLEEYSIRSEQYKLVDEASFYYEGAVYFYYLYQHL